MFLIGWSLLVVWACFALQERIDERYEKENREQGTVAKYGAFFLMVTLLIAPWIVLFVVGAKN